MLIAIAFGMDLGFRIFRGDSLQEAVEIYIIVVVEIG